MSPDTPWLPNADGDWSRHYRGHRLEVMCDGDLSWSWQAWGAGEWESEADGEASSDLLAKLAAELAVDDYYHLARRCLAATASAIAGTEAYLVPVAPQARAKRPEPHRKGLHAGWEWLTFARTGGGDIVHVFNPDSSWSRCGMKQRAHAARHRSGVSLLTCGHCRRVAPENSEVTP